MRDLDFHYPHAAFLIGLVFVISFLQFFLHYYRKKQTQNYASADLLPHLLTPRSSINTYLKMGAWSLLWALGCIALMGPEGNIRYLPSSTKKQSDKSNQTHELIFLVDTSGSMSVPDGRNGQTRLEQSKGIMDDVISQLKGVSVALYAFTSELTADVPPTLDYLFVRLMIKELHINEGDVGGTRFAPVLKDLAATALNNPLANSYTVFLFSDGGDNSVYDQTPPSAEALKDILDAVPDPDSLHLKIYTIGVGRTSASTIPNVVSGGKSVSSQLEPALLQKIAEKGHGEFFEAEGWSNWDLATKLSNAIDQGLKKQKEASPARTVAPVKEDEKLSDLYFQIPLGIAIILLLAGLALSETRKS